MRVSTADGKSRSQIKNSKSVASLVEAKKSADNFPFLRNSQLQRVPRDSLRESKGKLHLGQNAKPVIVLSREERLNPWGRKTTLDQELLAKKGIFTLVSMGVITKQTNCHELLNNRYELPPKEPEPLKDTFLTNPAILLNTYYETTKQQEQLEMQQKPKQPEKKEEKPQKIRLSGKKKVIKKEQPKFELPEEKIKLSFLNFHVERNEAYTEFVKRVKRTGQQSILKQFITQVQQFAVKYSLKKFTVVPELNQTRKTTEKHILACIINHKIYGIDLKMKGSGLTILANLIRMKLQRMKYRRMQEAVERLQRIKNKFKIKKYYRQMIEKRWKYVNFKLGSFTENQRRLVADNPHPIKPDVEIHILASAATPEELQTCYKWRERKKVQLTRLYNNEADHIILLLNREEDLSFWLTDIEGMASSWKKPIIHVFTSSLNKPLEEYGDIYFGLSPEVIAEIKRICSGKTAVLIPHSISAYLPKICDILGADLFAGTFTEESRAILSAEDEQEKGEPMMSKFTKITGSSLQMNRFYANKFKKMELANGLLESKWRIKQMLGSLKMPTPLSICLQGMNQRDFIRQFTRMVLTNKNINKWVLKLPNSTFSRGLAFLETDFLKIIKQTKKKAYISEEDIDQISRIMESILTQKIIIPHSSLLNGDEFMGLFKEKGGFIESYLDNCSSVCVFGRIQINGIFTLLGTYRKYYAENICFGASYPVELQQSIFQKIKQICSHLYQSSVFGYLTFELLIDDKTKEVTFIDLVPHLQQYSSLYFYYKRMLDMNEIDGGQSSNRLKRSIFYCPFIDNNGNKCESIQQFEQLLLNKKMQYEEESVEGVKFLYLNEGIPDVLSMVCFGKDENIVIRQCLDGLNFLVEVGGQFNKFDKKFKSRNSDGLYIMDIIWKLRQLKKQTSEK